MLRRSWEFHLHKFFIFALSGEDFTPCDSATGDILNYRRLSFFLIELLHLHPRFCLTFFGVRRGYAVGEATLFHLELKASAFVIAHQFT